MRVRVDRGVVRLAGRQRVRGGAVVGGRLLLDVELPGGTAVNVMDTVERRPSTRRVTPPNPSLRSGWPSAASVDAWASRWTATSSSRHRRGTGNCSAPPASVRPLRYGPALVYPGTMPRSTNRVHRTQDEWAGLVRAWEASGLGATAFARDKDISASSLYSWRKRLSLASPPDVEPVSFVPLVVDETSAAADAFGWRIQTRAGWSSRSPAPEPGTGSRWRSERSASSEVGTPGFAEWNVER